MTTGRINQVTILDPGAQGAQAEPPEGSGKYQAGGRKKQPQLPTASVHEAHALQEADSIAPTEFPKARSEMRCYQRCHWKNKPSHTSLRRRRPTVASSRTQGADTRQGYPQRFDRYLAEPAIHRPQTVPAH